MILTALHWESVQLIYVLQKFSSRSPACSKQILIFANLSVAEIFSKLTQFLASSSQDIWFNCFHYRLNFKRFESCDCDDPHFDYSRKLMNLHDCDIRTGIALGLRLFVVKIFKS